MKLLLYNKKRTVYRCFRFTDFQCRSSVCKSLSHTWLSWLLPSS